MVTGEGRLVAGRGLYRFGCNSHGTGPEDGFRVKGVCDPIPYLGSSEGRKGLLKSNSKQSIMGIGLGLRD